MTGFARAEKTAAGVTLSWELRTVNHRYLDITFRLPEPWRRFEPRFRQSVNGRIARGKLDATLRIEAAETAAPPLELDEALLAQLLAAIEAVRKRLTGQAQIDPAELLRWPGLMRISEPRLEELQPSVVGLLDQAMTDLAQARGREGERLAALIRQRLANLAELIAATRVRLPQIQAAIRTRLAERLAQLTENVDAERLEQELVLLAQRMDVAEELDRLEGHAAEIGAVLDRPEPAGRRLDFLMQELNREANTLGSKVPDLEATQLAVDMKVVIEQLREQAQNVE